MIKHTIGLNNETILVTGSPGFIGANLVLRLLSIMSLGTVISLDSMNDYYDPKLKEYRLSLINAAAENSSCNHFFIKGNLADKVFLKNVFETYKPSLVVNLAAQAGVRYSIDHPDAYIESNIIGFYNVLEACRHSYDDGSEGVKHLIAASSSSVYGGNRKVPFSETDFVDQPVSLYAATKKSDELLAYSYSKLYNIPVSMMRFFTVMGKAGRPDMFYFSATDKLVRGERIQIFNYGNMQRDFTAIDDVIEGLVRVMQGAPEKGREVDGLPIVPYQVLNIGGGRPENLLDFVTILCEELVEASVLDKDFDMERHIELVGMQPGDVPLTYADSHTLESEYGFKPKIGLRDMLRDFARWYKEYYCS